MPAWGADLDYKDPYIMQALGLYSPYTVPDGNANLRLLGKGEAHSFFKPDGWDPAVGCEKNFVGTYKCGNAPPKSVSVDGASGKIVNFDCKEQHEQCINFILELTNEGMLVFGRQHAGIRRGRGLPASMAPIDELIKSSLARPDNPIKTVNAAPRTNESVNPDQQPGDINKLNLMVLNSELPGLSRKHTKYMYPSQELKRGEYLCSSTGNCMLVLDHDGNFEVRAIKLKTENIGGTMQGTKRIGGTMQGTDSKSCALYELSGLNVRNLEKVANISVDGQRRLYGYKQLELGTKYVEITGTDLTGETVTYDNPEDTLEIIPNETEIIDYCFEQCTNRLDTCGGFTVSKNEPNKCHLKTTNVFSVGNRVQNNSTQLYKRLYAPKYVSESCSKPGNTDVVAIDSVLFDHYPIDTEDPRMKSSTLCGADQVVTTPSSAFETATAKLTELYDAVMNSISATISKQTQYNTLREDPSMDVSGKIIKYKKKSDEIAKYTEKQETIQGTEEDARIELISETYKYVLWSILAIVIIIAIVYYGDIGSYPTNISSVTDIFKSSSTEI